MPRRWTNSSGGSGGSLNHQFVPATPFRIEGAYGIPNLWEVEQTLIRNAKIAGRDKEHFRKRR